MSKLLSLFVSLVEQQFWLRLSRPLFFLRWHDWQQESRVLGPLGLGGAGQILIDQNVSILSKSRFNRAGVNHSTKLSSQAGVKFSIGSHVGISGAPIFFDDRIRVEKKVHIGGNCNIFGSDFRAVDRMDYKAGHKALSAPIIIEDDVWLCAIVAVFIDATICAQSLIGAESEVTSNIPPDCLAGEVSCAVFRNLVPSYSPSII